MKKIVFLLIIILLILACQKILHIRDGKFLEIETLQDLNKTSAFSFAIMSDNKGDSGKNSKMFKHMKTWIEQSKNSFVIGLGDHVKKGWNNSFLDFLNDNKWWNENFYPNIADGENEFFGKGQGDWGAGAELLNYVDMDKNAIIDMRDNKCEYFLKRKIGVFTVYLVQLHFPDEPADESISFKEDSREYLATKLRSIQKSCNDIVIAAAHSRNGFWFDELNPEQQNILMEKCDLVLSATTHFFKRKVIEGHENDGPLFINTGSITYPYKFCPFGYVQVNVLEYPSALVVQYLNAARGKPEMQTQDYAFIKLINGKIINTNFREYHQNEDSNRIIGYLNEQIDPKEMQMIAENLYLQNSDCEEAWLRVDNGLTKGEIKYKDLWEVFPYNNEICQLSLSKSQMKKINSKSIKPNKKNYKIALSLYYANYLIGKFSLPKEQLVKTGKKEIDLLENWVRNHKSEEK